jgi:hypothetical protein
MAGYLEISVTCPKCHGQRPPVDDTPRKVPYIEHGRHHDYTAYARVYPIPPFCQLCHNRDRVKRKKAENYYRTVPDFLATCYYGAVAVPRHTGPCGLSWNYMRPREAVARARAEANDQGAEIILIACCAFLALAQDAQGWYHGGWDPKQDSANQRAIEAAGSGGRLIDSFHTKDGRGG